VTTLLYDTLLTAQRRSKRWTHNRKWKLRVRPWFFHHRASTTAKSPVPLTPVNLKRQWLQSGRVLFDLKANTVCLTESNNLLGSDFVSFAAYKW